MTWVITIDLASGATNPGANSTKAELHPGGKRCPYSRGAGNVRETSSFSSTAGASSQRLPPPTIPVINLRG